MCTAITYRTKDFYFGRTLDFDFSYGEEITVTPRHYPFPFRYMGNSESHYAIIGMAHVEDGYPLYYDGVNEKGLGMAGLYFPGNAVYGKAAAHKDNVATFELIPWILGQCASVKEARGMLENLNLTDDVFSAGLPTSPLHWMIADRCGAVTMEVMADGMHIYENPVGVLTNNPPFESQMFALNNYMHLSPREPENLFSSALPLRPYSRGMGALGLPGDLSSQSRFIRAAFTRLHAVSGESEPESVGQFFHILGSVEQQWGCCEVGNGKYEMTIYTSCCNGDRGIYYYTTYENHQITAVDLHKTDLEGSCLTRYALIREEQIQMMQK